MLECSGHKCRRGDVTIINIANSYGPLPYCENGLSVVESLIKVIQASW